MSAIAGLWESACLYVGFSLQFLFITNFLLLQALLASFFSRQLSSQYGFLKQFNFITLFFIVGSYADVKQLFLFFLTNFVLSLHNYKDNRKQYFETMQHLGRRRWRCYLNLVAFGEIVFLVTTFSCRQLNLKKEPIVQKCLAWAKRRKIVFRQDHARPQSLFVTRQKHRELGWDVLMHPLYISVLTPSVCDL